MTSLLICYYSTSSSRQLLRHSRNVQEGDSSCSSATWVNVSSEFNTKKEIDYIYELSINTTAISLDSAKTKVKSNLLNNISLDKNKYICCSNKYSYRALYSSSSSLGKLAFALSADEPDLEDTSGIPCSSSSSGTAAVDSTDKCTPIVGNVFLLTKSSNNKNNTGGDETAAAFTADILGAIQYSMDQGKLNRSPYMNVTYVGTRNTTNINNGGGGGWAYIPILNNAKDSFLDHVDGVLTTVQNKTPGVLNTVQQNAPPILLGPMGIASVVIASCLLLFALIGCWCKYCRSNNTQGNKSDGGEVELTSEPSTPKTETSIVSTTQTNNKNVAAASAVTDKRIKDFYGSDGILSSLSIVENVSEDDVEIALDPNRTTTRASEATENTTTTSINKTVFPSVYEEGSEMLRVAILTYAYATLRQCASKNPGKYRGEQAILHDGPVTGTKIFGFIKDNIEILKNEQEFQGEDGLFALKQLQMVLMDVDADNNTRSSNGELVVFNDKDPKQLCYGITLNKAEKRIVVSFRGTSSFYDAIDDIKVAGAKVANPLYGETKRQKSSLQLHQGFYDCLFVDKEEEQTKFEVIMGQLVEISKKNPDYKIYVTGHSLGGALATLFTFFASTPQYLNNLAPYPLTCVSIASPLVGNNEWRRAFMLQEKLGRIRHLRVTNYGDVVPKVPQVSLGFFPFTYRHVGAHLQLYDDMTSRFSYPKEGESMPIDAKENIIVPLTHSQMLHLHGCDTYSSRIDSAMERLQKTYLDEMYASVAFVGNYSNV